MSKTVSARFLAAENAPANHITSRAFLISRNYANSGNGATATASSEYSTDYPASGVIDGDRTMLSMGAAADAENGTGKSSWRSSGTTPASEYVTIDLGQARTFNRIKLYQQTGHGISYSVYYYSADYGDWCLLYTTTAGTPSTTGYGTGAYGTTPYGDPPEVQTYYGVDCVDIGYDVTAQLIKIVGVGTEVASDYLNILEVEVYRLVDISSRFISSDTQMQQDYALQTDMVQNGTIIVDNTDRFFSPDYSPTAAEIAAGFINSELGTGLGLIVQHGYQWSGSEKEYVTNFVGNIDQYQITPADRTATFTCRNQKGKDMVNAVRTSRWPRYCDTLENNVAYAVQLANIHPSECSIENTGFQNSIFFLNNQSVYDALKALILPLGKGRFYISSEDVPTVKWNTNLSSTELTFSIAMKEQYQKGTLNNVDPYTYPNSLTLGQSLGDFQNESYQPDWTLITNTNATVGYDSDNKLLKITQTDTTLATVLRIRKASTQAYGAWSFYWDGNTAWDADSSINIAGVLYFFFMLDNAGTSGYAIKVLASNSSVLTRSISLVRWDTGAETVVGTAAISTSPGRIGIYRTALGAFVLYRDESVPDTGVAMGTDTTYTTSVYSDVYITLAQSSILSAPYISFGRIKTTSISGAFTSEVIYAGDNFSAWGAFSANVQNNGAYTSITFKYRTSADGSTWGSWTTITSGSTPSGTNPYIQLYAEFTGQLGTDKPILSGMSIHYYATKVLPTPDTITINDYAQMLDFSITYSDVLSGDSSVYNKIVASIKNFVPDTAYTSLWEACLPDTSTKISDDTPYSVAAGTYTFSPTLSDAADPKSLSVIVEADVAGAATGAITTEHMLTPAITITVSADCNITSIKIMGQALPESTMTTQTASDSASIAKYGVREYDIDVPYCFTFWAASLAAILLDRYKAMIGYVDSLKSSPILRAELADQVTWSERSTSGSAKTYQVIGITHRMSSSTAETDFELRS